MLMAMVSTGAAITAISKGMKKAEAQVNFIFATSRDNCQK